MFCSSLSSSACCSLGLCSRGMSLEGLGKKLSNHPVFRKRMLKTDLLIAWPSPKVMGVCRSPDALRMNADLLMLIADFWCPQWTAPTMIPVDFAKEEVMVWVVKTTNQKYFKK